MMRSRWIGPANGRVKSATPLKTGWRLKVGVMHQKTWKTLRSQDGIEGGVPSEEARMARLVRQEATVIVNCPATYLELRG
ncbi:hypothetical protein NDU88_005100 [Pleurodeles waltl]|uniref:Uncharacterized protein n=1 Tax=Pleurodeles waltl TaxID=8319 RepID=A0AAV7WXA7_PLEWA|nr:hypothetical protein NDU88_005100 [Pleurodeles waltl]